MRVHVVRSHPDREALPSDADLVLRVPPTGPAADVVLDRWGQVYSLVYTDDDPSDLALVECMERIKRAWEDAHEEAREVALGHSAAALWFFYWVSPDMIRMPELVRRNRSQDLRAAATDYLDAGFGESRGPTLALEAA